jgi:hypothetical protein
LAKGWRPQPGSKAAPARLPAQLPQNDSGKPTGLNAQAFRQGGSVPERLLMAP